MKQHKHPNLIFGLTAEEFSEQAANLRFDAMADLFGHLADEIFRRAKESDALQRIKLGFTLTQLAIVLKKAADWADDAWELSEPKTVTDRDLDIKDNL